MDVAAVWIRDSLSHSQNATAAKRRLRTAGKQRGSDALQGTHA